MTNAEKILKENAETLAVIGKSPSRAGQIIAASRQPMRVVDRALQRLRRAGKIKLRTGPGGGWVRA